MPSVITVAKLIDRVALGGELIIIRDVTPVAPLRPLERPPLALVTAHRRAIELARERPRPIAQIAADLGISESCLGNWLAQADIDEGRHDGVSSDDRAELVRLRRENRVLKMERDILVKAAAFFATENVTPK